MRAQLDSSPRRAGVLVVDDDERVRRLCARSLRALGFEVVEASGGWEAIELVTEHQRDIDVVVTDILMPDLNGIELVARLRAVHPRLGIVLMSGYAPSELFQRAAFAAAFPLLRKPFRTDQLYDKVREVLRETSERPGSVRTSDG